MAQTSWLELDLAVYIFKGLLFPGLTHKWQLCSSRHRRSPHIWFPQALKGSSSGQGSFSDDDQRGEDQPAPTEDSSEDQAAKREHAAEQRRLSKMDKAARMREKNKIAQKRWRERQKVGSAGTAFSLLPDDWHRDALSD